MILQGIDLAISQDAVKPTLAYKKTLQNLQPPDLEQTLTEKQLFLTSEIYCFPDANNKWQMACRSSKKKGLQEMENFVNRPLKEVEEREGEGPLPRPTNLPPQYRLELMVAAIIKGVAPLSPVASMNAPSSNSNSTTSTCPMIDAQ